MPHLKRFPNQSMLRKSLTFVGSSPTYPNKEVFMGIDAGPAPLPKFRKERVYRTVWNDDQTEIELKSSMETVELCEYCHQYFLQENFFDLIGEHLCLDCLQERGGRDYLKAVQELEEYLH